MQDFKAEITLGTLYQITKKKKQYILQNQKKWIILNILYKPPKSNYKL